MSENFFFEKLNVYQRSLKFAIALCRIASKFPIKFSRIRDQLTGAVISIPLNIAEGSGRKSVKERINFYKISRSSIFEIVPILEICLKLKLIEKTISQDLREEAVVLSKMINGLISSL